MLYDIFFNVKTKKSFKYNCLICEHEKRLTSCCCFQFWWGGAPDDAQRGQDSSKTLETCLTNIYVYLYIHYDTYWHGAQGERVCQLFDLQTKFKQLSKVVEVTVGALNRADLRCYQPHVRFSKPNERYERRAMHLISSPDRERLDWIPFKTKRFGGGEWTGQRFYPKKKSQANSSAKDTFKVWDGSLRLY